MVTFEFFQTSGVPDRRGGSRINQHEVANLPVAKSIAARRVVLQPQSQCEGGMKKRFTTCWGSRHEANSS
jgi:hypothetical protein